MKMLVAAILLASLSAAGAANVDNDHNEKKARWELPADVLGTSNQISFNQRAGGAWYFMEGTSLAHDPVTYQFLPQYFALCPAPVPLAGLACWGEALDPANPLGTYPQVAINFYDHVVTDSGSGSHPAHSMTFHPRGSRLAIIAWRSPEDYTIDMTGDIRSLYPTLNCGDGVRWTIERGTTVLASGDTSLNTGSGFNIKKLDMAKGEAIYLIADPKTTDMCDSTLVSVAISARDNR